jgi:hypothetical protein
MPRRSVPVLADTNVILECHRTTSWRALTGGYGVETVEECVTETQTGFQNRRPEQRVDETSLRKSLARVNAVADAERAAAAIRDSRFAALDPGERDLWAHALTRTGAWVLCGPDRASLRLGVRLGLRDRLVSLEELLRDIGHRPKLGLRRPYTARWLADCLNELIVLEGGKLP